MRHFLAVAATLGLACASCLPADTRPPPGSVLLTVTSGDEPVVMTADGWSMTVDRLLIGLGGAQFEHRQDCEAYSDTSYDRLLDATLRHEQKLSIIYGLGGCPFQFAIRWPSAETVLGEGVTEADREDMGGFPELSPEHPPGIAVDFAATATRGSEVKRVHWRFRQSTGYFNCSLRAEGGAPLPLVLDSDENLAAPIAVRGTVLFLDDAATTGDAQATAELRFDVMAAADTAHGNDDGEVTLDELAEVSLDEARRFGGRYNVDPGTPTPSKLADYLHLGLFRRLVEPRQPFGCQAPPGSRPPMSRPEAHEVATPNRSLTALSTSPASP